MRHLLLFALSLSLAGCDYGSRNSVTVDDAWIRLPAAAGQPAAGYATVTWTEDVGALVAVSSPQAKKADMHETVMSGSTASMRQFTGIQPMSHTEIVFEPGGRHLMLYDLDPALKRGGKAALVFHFEHGATVTAHARVAAAGDEAPY